MDTTTWPRWATESIEIVDPDPSWQALGCALIAEIEARLARWLRDGVHHVGSTAVPGLAAKPVIDLMAGVESLAPAEQIAHALRPDGWHFVPPELDRRPWRRFFVKASDDRRMAHLHVMSAHTPRWNHQLVFRDRLRDSAGLRREYAQLKRQLAAQHARDREAYAAGKSDFISRVLREAGFSGSF